MLPPKGKLVRLGASDYPDSQIVWSVDDVDTGFFDNIDHVSHPCHQ